MVWVDEKSVSWSEDNMEATIDVNEDNVIMKFDAQLIGTDAKEAEEKLKKAVDDVRWAAYGRYDNMDPVGNVLEKDGELHYVGTLTIERRTMTGKHDSEELSCFLSDMLECSGIRKWPESFVRNETKEFIAHLREDIRNLYKEDDDDRINYLVREQLGRVLGDRDHVHRKVIIGSSKYNHGLPDGKAIKRIDIFLRKEGTTFKLMSNDEIFYYAKSHQTNIVVRKEGTPYNMNVARVDDNIFNCQYGRPIFIRKGSYLTFRYDEGLFGVYTPKEFETDLQVIDIEIPDSLKGNIKYYFGDNPDTFGTLENNNKMTTARMTVGVIAGYDVKNPSDERAMELAECAVKEVKSSILEDIPMPNIELKPAMAVYLPEWGCPQGGEKCIQVDIGPMEKSEATLFAMGMQAALDQSTVTVNFADGESLYITRDENKIPQIKRFSSMQYDIPLIGADPKAAGEKIQAALQEYGRSHQDAQIYATGAVVVEQDGSLHYVGSRNALFCQDEDSFAKALSDMLDISSIIKH